MIRRWRNFKQAFQDNILKKGNEADSLVEQKFDFKGQRIQAETERAPKITREQIDQFSRLDPPIQPQTREIRMKNIFYMGVYMAWFSGIVLFIMYRLKGDDLAVMEKEAEERIKLRQAMKDMREESSRR